MKIHLDAGRHCLDQEGLSERNVRKTCTSDDQSHHSSLESQLLVRFPYFLCPLPLWRFVEQTFILTEMVQNPF